MLEAASGGISRDQYWDTLHLPLLLSRKAAEMYESALIKLGWNSNISLFSRNTPAKIISSPPSSNSYAGDWSWEHWEPRSSIVYTSSTSTFLHTDVLHVCLQTSASPVEAWTSASSTHCLQEECARAVRWAVIEVIKRLGPNRDDCHKKIKNKKNSTPLRANNKLKYFQFMIKWHLMWPCKI